jgi:hypothetical protein
VKVLSVAELLRKVGATAEAAYCDLMAQFRAISRGLDTEGNRVSATQNMVQMEAAVQTLRDMRHACMEGLNQKKRGVSRLRGFITEELFRVFEMDVASFHSILELAEANEFDVTKMQYDALVGCQRNHACAVASVFQKLGHQRRGARRCSDIGSIHDRV